MTLIIAANGTISFEKMSDNIKEKTHENHKELYSNPHQNIS